MRFRGFTLVLPFLAVFSAMAQRGQAPVSPRTGSSIIDDTTRNIYGPKTALWTTERELFDNRPNYRPLDTAVNNYHRWTYVQAFNNTYKDLGVMGTALSPIFPVVPTAIGASSGFQVYEPYYATEEPKYFDTKSPYTRMFVVWGGNGRAATRVEFSRNINPRWNIGFNYRPILVDKQLQRQKGVRQTISHYYDYYTTYKTKDERYKLLFNFRRIRHKVEENGGVALQPGEPTENIFDENAGPVLTEARSEEFRRNYHLFHQFQLAKPFQVYHIVDLTEHENVFTDLPGFEPPDYFDHNEPVSTDTTFDKTTFSTTQQEFGIKGTASKFFYSAYYKIRTFQYGNRYFEGIELAVDPSGVENYLGGRLSLKLDSVSEFSGSAEYLLNGYYRIEGQIQTPWIDGFFRNTLSKPGLMQQVYRGSHDYWNQSFSGINATQAQGFLKLNTPSVALRAGGTFNLLSNSVYFRQVPGDATNTQTVLPFQSAGIQSTFSPEVRMSFRFFRHMYVRPQIIYTAFLRNDDEVLKIPELFVNGQLTYENLLFKAHLQVQAGVEFHWQSTYQALGYDPVIQQFYVQTPLVNSAFPLVDVFLTGKMGRGRFFVKYSNLVQTFTVTGYMPTPGYPGQNPQIDFGFDFLLFD